jgi:hypothetical protein
MACDLDHQGAHRARRVTWLGALAIAFVALVGACGDDDGDDGGPAPVGLAGRDRPSAEFRFGDSSVPPQYHRSFTLEITPDAVHATIDSYGDVLLDETVPLDDATWDSFATGLDRRTEDPRETDDGCTGGTSRTLVLRAGDTVLEETSFGVCGSDGNDDAAAELDALVAPLTALVPGWDEAMA